MQMVLPRRAELIIIRNPVHGKHKVDTACMGVKSKPTPTGQKWITEKELARHLHVSRRHLVNLRKNGLPHVLLGSSVRYKLEEIEAYLCGTRRISSNLEFIKSAPADAGNPGGRP